MASDVVHQICRLCLSEESLEDVFREEGLHQLISDFLTITISTDDRLSHAICAICRIRLSEFDLFRIRCLEVQDVLQSMIQSEKVDSVPVKIVSVIDGGLTIDSKSQDQIGAFGQRSHATQCESVAISQVNIEPYDEIESKEIKEVYCSDSDMEKQTNSFYDIEQQHQEFYNESSDSHQLDDIDGLIAMGEVKIESHKDVETGKVELDSNVYTSSTFESEPPKRKTSSTTTHQCETCPEVFPTKKKLRWHRRYHRTNLFCPVCERPFVSETTMQKHMNSHLSKEERKEKLNNVGTVFKCDECPKVFPNKYKLSAHKIYHKSKKFACKFCEKKFTFPYKLKLHLERHGHEDFYEDSLPSSPEEQREEELTTPNEVVQDSQHHNSPSTQTEEGKLECKICHRTFGTQNELSEHFRYGHQRKFNCATCDAAFTSNKLLRWHMSVIHNQKEGPTVTIESIVNEQIDSVTASTGTHQCKKCRKEFLTAKCLAAHEEVYCQNFLCLVCGKRFASRANLRSHSRKFHPSEEH